jgi:transposase
MDLPSEIRIPAKRRRRHSAQFKAQVLAETFETDASIASVAQRHNLNANLIHKWRRTAERDLPATTAGFVSLLVPPAPVNTSGTDVRIEIASACRTVNVFWPCDQPLSLANFIKTLS